MKLLYVAQIRLPTRKAHGVQIMNMCTAFADQGILVELVVPRWRPTEKMDAFDYYGVVRNFSINRLLSPRLSGWGPTGYLLETLLFAVIASLYSLASTAGIIYSRNLLPLLFIGLFTNKQLVWETHTQMRGKWSRFLATIISKTNIKIITITKALETELIDIYGIKAKKIMVASDGVDLSKYLNLPSQAELRKELDLSMDKFVVSYVGRYRTMGQEKGVAGLIEAFGIIEKDLERALLLLVGIHEGERPDVLKLLEHFSIASYKIVPVVPASKVSGYLVASDTLIMNYPLSDHYAHFMSPLKMFEYMASGRPIVSSDLPSIREVLNSSNSVLVEPDNSRALADGILNIARDKARAVSIAKKALEDVEEYTWNKRAGKILSFITEFPQNEK